jgi:hypothetical protein
MNIVIEAADFQHLLNGKTVRKQDGSKLAYVRLNDIGFNEMERILHKAVEESGWCLHCFTNGVGGPGQGCAVEGSP